MCVSTTHPLLVDMTVVVLLASPVSRMGDKPPVGGGVFFGEVAQVPLSHHMGLVTKTVQMLRQGGHIQGEPIWSVTMDCIFL